MELRKLEMKDALLMLEWMHDESIVGNLQTNFIGKTLEDCENFIKDSEDESCDLHLAIALDDGTYMGTVSLKHIEGHFAEFAIVVRKAAMGKGYSQFGMKKMIQIGFEKFGLKQIYWCVNPQNKRACRFYDKQGYERVDIMKDDELLREVAKGGYKPRQISSYCWYRISSLGETKR